MVGGQETNEVRDALLAMLAMALVLSTSEYWAANGKKREDLLEVSHHTFVTFRVVRTQVPQEARKSDLSSWRQ